MRKPKTHVICRGNLRGEGPTRTDAKNDLESAINRACNREGPIMESRFGLVIVVAADSNGWTHTIINPAEFAHGARKLPACYHAWTADRDAVLQGARSHAAQWAWSPAIGDDSAFVAAAGLDAERSAFMQSWIKFQRDYIAGRNMRVDILAVATGVLERLAVPLGEAVPDPHELVRTVAEIRAHGSALVGGGAAPGFIVRPCDLTA